MPRARKVHYNIRHVSAGRPVPYCHAVCESHEVSMHVREVTCGICCDFLDGFAAAVDARDERSAQSSSGVSGARGAVLAAFLAAGLAASAFFLKRHL